jgi:hypothetical protein
MLLASTSVPAAEFTRRTGWSIKPQGACKAEVCVPLPPEVHDADGTLRVSVLAERLGMPLIEDQAHRLWALGPESAVTGRYRRQARRFEADMPDGDPKRYDSNWATDVRKIGAENYYPKIDA